MASSSDRSSARSSPNSSSKAAPPRRSSPSGSAASRAGKVRREGGRGVSSIDLREVAWPLRAKRYDGGQQARCSNKSQQGEHQDETISSRRRGGFRARERRNGRDDA